MNSESKVSIHYFRSTFSIFIANVQNDIIFVNCLPQHIQSETALVFEMWQAGNEVNQPNGVNDQTLGKSGTQNPLKPQIILLHWMFGKLGGINSPYFSSCIKTTPLNFAALNHAKTRIRNCLPVKINHLVHMCEKLT